MPPIPTPQSLRERAAQCVMVRVGSNLPPGTTVADDVARVEALLARCPVGGLILFNAAWPGVAGALRRLQAASRIPLWVGADLERGAGQQVQGATRFPHAMAAGHAKDPEAAAATLARATAHEARACGIHAAFAPVADVNTHAENPIIGTRAFGTEPDAVALAVAAYVRAARAEGFITCAKHFPGHGRTATDSHATLPVVEASREDLEAIDLPPFRAAIQAGVDTVMTAHVAFPALDPSGGPATASRPILHDLLRDALGFEGLVLSDSLLMEGVQTADADPGTQAAALLAAGVDVLLDPDDPEAVVNGLVRAVREGTLDEARLDEAAARVHRLKVRIRETQGDAAFQPTGTDPVVGSDALAADAARMAREALTVDVRQPGAWPQKLGDGRGLLVVDMTTRTGDAGPSALVAGVRAHLPDASVVQVGGDTDRGAELIQQARRADAVLAACTVEPAAWHDFGLPDAHRTLLRRMAAATPLALVALGSPHILAEVPSAAVHLCTYSSVPASQQAVLNWLVGGSVDGRVG